jgi:hypothetical protein
MRHIDAQRGAIRQVGANDQRDRALGQVGQLIGPIDDRRGGDHLPVLVGRDFAGLELLAVEDYLAAQSRCGFPTTVKKHNRQQHHEARNQMTEHVKTLLEQVGRLEQIVGGEEQRKGGRGRSIR